MDSNAKNGALHSPLYYKMKLWWTDTNTENRNADVVQLIFLWKEPEGLGGGHYWSNHRAKASERKKKKNLKVNPRRERSDQLFSIQIHLILSRGGKYLSNCALSLYIIEYIFKSMFELNLPDL